MKNYLLEFLFENRNKAYGAYELRTNYERRLTRATLLGCLGVTAILFSSFVFLHTNKNTSIPDEPRIIEVILDDIRQKDPFLEIAEPPTNYQVEKLVEPDPVENAVPEDAPFSNLKDLIVAIIGTEKKEGPNILDAFTPPVVPQVPVLEEKPKEEVLETTNEILLAPEIYPSFPDGNEAMYQWLAKELRYPALAQRHQVQGRVFVSFIVEKDGSISQFETLKPVGFGLDEEALRVLKKMPKWNPGLQNGKPARVRFTIPITFKLSN